MSARLFARMELGSHWTDFHEIWYLSIFRKFVEKIQVSVIKLVWTTPDFRNTPSTTNLEEEEIVDAPGNDGNASMPEQVKRPNPWRKMMMMMMINKVR
jgi:hypothetical protein